MAKKTASGSKKRSSKKAASKKAASKKRSVKKAGSSKKASSKKAGSKKAGSKARAVKKAGSKKSSTKKTTTESKKTVSKKAASKKAGSKKSAAASREGSSANAKKSPAKKGGSQKAAAAPAKGSGGSKKPSRGKAGEKKKEASKSSGEESGGAGSRFRGVFSSRAGEGGGGADAAAELLKSAGLTGEERTHAAAAESREYEKLKKSPFNKRQLEKFKGILRIKRAQLVGDVTNMEAEALMRGESGSLSHLPQHMADAGSDTYDQSLNLNLAAGQRRLLREIDDALYRIEAGTFGICERLGKPIGEERLEYTPWARYSIEGARELERLGLPIDRPPSGGYGAVGGGE